jgi:AcrR family transcriptional regulator
MGRPREFGIDEAVCIATELPWRKGYEGTALTDLTKAMGITPPSFCSAVDNNEGPFKKVLVHYQATHFRYFEKALKEPTARAVAKRLLYGFADGHTSSENPAGCLCVNCAMPAVGSSDPIRRELTQMRQAGRMELAKRFKRAKTSGDLPADADPEGLARFIMGIGWGRAVDAQTDASRKELHRVVETVLRALPN